ncbi:MAG: DUF1667 domain-containing protein [Ruminococcaceae bacterium]|nr:DUF1667 domain-containing protein [Oscillospiraceae bacterium]
MKKIDLTCVVCPFGCLMQIELDDNDKIISVTGNTCKRGETYAENEITDPRRNICSTVRIEGSKVHNVVPVKTSSEIPKDKIFECMKEINKVVAKVPVKIGDVLISNVLGTKVDIVATNNVLD